MIKKDIAFEKDNLNPYEKFNRNNLYILILIILLPLIYKILKKKYTYLELFDRLSVPILIALYSYFWLKYTNTIEKKRLIISKTKKIEDIKKHIQLFSIDELKEMKMNLMNLIFL